MRVVAGAHCEVTGLPFLWLPGTTWRTNPLAASFDRIDNSGGYVHGDIRAVSWLCNLGLNEFESTIHLGVSKFALDNDMLIRSMSDEQRRALEGRAEFIAYIKRVTELQMI